MTLQERFRFRRSFRRSLRRQDRWSGSGIDLVALSLLVQNPTADQLISGVAGPVANPPLMAIFLATLDVQRLPQQFATLHIVEIDAFLQ